MIYVYVLYSLLYTRHDLSTLLLIDRSPELGGEKQDFVWLFPIGDATKKRRKIYQLRFFFDKYAERDPTISEVMSYTKYTFKRNHFETRALRSICTATAVRVIGVVICRHTFCLCIQRDWNKACQSSLLEKMYIQTSFDVTPQENGRSVVLLPVVVAAYNDGERLHLIDPRDGKDPDTGPELTFTSGS